VFVHLTITPIFTVSIYKIMKPKDLLIRTIRLAQHNMNQPVQPATDFDNFSETELRNIAESMAKEQAEYLKNKRNSEGSKGNEK
jgi:hypothetical protein